jgi:hypothetical protein
MDWCRLHEMLMARALPNPMPAFAAPVLPVLIVTLPIPRHLTLIFTPIAKTRHHRT